MRRYFFLMMLFIIPSCAAPQSPAQTVFALEAGYDAALNIAIAYATLPRCAPAGPVLCSDAAIVRQANAVAQQAWAALRAAEAAVRTAAPNRSRIVQAIAAAQAALAAFRAITDHLPTNHMPTNHMPTNHMKAS